MRRHQLAAHLILILATGILLLSPAASATSLDVSVEDTSAREMVVSLKPGTYSLLAAGGGQRLVMEGFHALSAPGRPRLPMRRVLLALPPGTIAESIEIVSTRTETLPGTYNLEPHPGIAFLPGTGNPRALAERIEEERRSEYRKIYFSDAPFPEEPVRLTGRGTLRKYPYAEIAFSPFTYYPASGRVERHSRVEVIIHYGAAPGRGCGPGAGALSGDDIADHRARRLFANYDDIADLYDPTLSAPAPTTTWDYVIVTTSGLAGAVSSSGFPGWKASLGHSVRTVLTTDPEIAGQPGADLAQRIRNFLREYYLTWGIEYVLFVGDYATVPMRICYPDPDFHVYDPSDPNLVAPGTPTDYYYADLSYPDSISWDLDGDGYPGEYSDDAPDFLAEVAVGRIPVNDLSRITYALDKITAFEQDTGSWKTNVLHGGAILFFENQNHGDYPFIDGASCLDSMEVGLMGGYSITHFSEQSGIVTSLFPWPALTEAVFTSEWGSGEYAIVNWSGHGWCDGAARTVWNWDDGDGIPEHSNGEIASYLFIGTGAANVDDDHPSIVFAISCNVGYPDPNPYGNLGIDMLTLPGWGPSAGVVSSARPAAISRDFRNDPGGTEQICYEFNRYMIVEEERVGDALYDGKYYATSNYGWDRVYENMNLFNYNLFGDPALSVGGISAGVAGGDAPGPALLKAAPNPFTGVTDIRFTIPEAGPVRVAVHDVRGRLVRVLEDGVRTAGECRLSWDGTDSGGRRLAPGLYFARVKAAGEKATGRLVLLR
jgi:hypothetical protein